MSAFRYSEGMDRPFPAFCRRRKRWLLPVIAAFAASTAGCSYSEDEDEDRRQGCGVATAYVRQFVYEATRYRRDHDGAPEITAVRHEPYQLLPQFTENGPVRKERAEEFRDVRDWREIGELSGESVLETCPELEGWLSDREVLTDAELIAALRSSDEWEAIVLTIAMPVLTADKRHAVVFASEGTGGNSGVGILAIYSQDDEGRWLLVDKETRWVS